MAGKRKETFLNVGNKTLRLQKRTLRQGSERLVYNLEDADESTLAGTLIEDLRELLRYVSANEIVGQQRIGNTMTNLIVDGKNRKMLDTAEKTVVAFFADPEIVIRAATETYEMLKSLAVFQARELGVGDFALYAIYNNGTPKLVSKGLSGLRSTVMNMDLFKDQIAIAGPMVHYGRVSYWQPGGEAKYRTKRLRPRNMSNAQYAAYNKLMKSTGIGAISVKKRRGMHDLVVDRMRRKYRMVRFGEDWFRTEFGPFNKSGDKRTPAIFISYRLKGRTELSSVMLPQPSP